MVISSKRILILTEDTYGIDFFRKLINRLKSQRFIKINYSFKYRRYPGVCNSKLCRILKSIGNNLVKIIIVADADGMNKNHVKSMIEKHIPNEFKNITKYIIFNHCIEEWICEGLGVTKCFSHNPVHILNNYLRQNKGREYEKYMLPSFADKLDLKKLLNNQEFKYFLNCINCKC